MTEDVYIRRMSVLMEKADGDADVLAELLDLELDESDDPEWSGYCGLALHLMEEFDD